MRTILIKLLGNNRVLVLLSILLSMVLLYFTISNYMEIQGLKTVITPKFAQNQTDIGNTVYVDTGCKYQGAGAPLYKVLTLYKVRQGDSILSLAKNLLQDVTRVQEIIDLNKKQYTNLNLPGNTFLEVGWEILLPPTYIKLKGFTSVTAGKISQIDKSEWQVDVGIKNHPFVFTLAENTKLMKDFKTGDCIYLLRDQAGNTFDQKTKLSKDVIGIYPQ